MNTQHPMPALFLGHGNPMNAIETTRFSKTWELLGQRLSRPRAILSISAHWETQGTWVTAMDTPRTLHDFGNFPKALFDMQYPAKGDPELARQVQSLLAPHEVELDFNWGLDHGTWCLLSRMYPDAGIPVVQLSLNRGLTVQQHYEIGKQLAPLRKQEVLILGSGNIVHNLGAMSPAPGEKPYDWALAFDEAIKERLLAGDHPAILDYESLGEIARLSVPTPEHFLPLIYIAALQGDRETVMFPVEGMDLKAISMRSVQISSDI